MRSERQLGIGVVGINPRIRRTIHAGIVASHRARLVAVCSRDPVKAAEAAAAQGCAAYTSFAAMLADPAVEAVFVCTPHHLHHPMSLAALGAGKRVICEKPLAVTVAEAEELVEAATRLGLPTVVNFTYHSLPGQCLVARLLGQGAIGRLRHLDLSYWQAREALPDARKGDALFEVGSHEVDLARWWTELGGAGALCSVVAQEDRRSGDDGADWTPILTALGRTEGGAQVSLQANRVAAGWRNGMVCRLIGEEGALTLSFDTDVAEVRLARFGEGSPEGIARPIPIPADLAVTYQDFPGFHVDHLVAALQGDGEFPDFAYGLRCQRVVDALRVSAREQRWVELGQ